VWKKIREGKHYKHMMWTCGEKATERARERERPERGQERGRGCVHKGTTVGISSLFWQESVASPAVPGSAPLWSCHQTSVLPLWPCPSFHLLIPT